MTLEELASKIVQDQNFDYINFDNAKVDLEVEIDNIQYRLSYDCLTTTLYIFEPMLDPLVSFRSLIKNGLLRKLNQEQMKCLCEYQALFWYCACNRLEFPSIMKSLRPDFIVTDRTGRKIGIEIMELTSEIDRKRRTVHRLIGKLSHDAAVNKVNKYLKRDATKFEVKKLGSSLTLIPREATCLTDQRVSNALKLYGKYKKYFVKDDTGTKFDEFIVLGNGLHSEIAIISKRDAEHILEELRKHCFCHKIGFVILFIDNDTRTICSKGMIVGFENIEI